MAISLHRTIKKAEYSENALDKISTANPLGLAVDLLQVNFMSFSTYIFDLDGTLLDTIEDVTVAVNYSMSKINCSPCTLDEVKGFLGNGYRMLIKRSAPDEATEDEIDKALCEFVSYYNEHLMDFTKPFDGIVEIINELSNGNKTLAVVSNKNDFATQTVIKRFFGDKFDIVVGKRDCFKLKPNPDSLLYVMNELNAKPDECVYIGDSEVDVQTAHNAGIKCIGVTWGNRDKSVLISNGADYIVDSADYISRI